MQFATIFPASTSPPAKELVENISSAAAANQYRSSGVTPRTAINGVRRDKAALSSGCEARPPKSLPLEVLGAGMEVTKCPKPSIRDSISLCGVKSMNDRKWRFLPVQPMTAFRPELTVQSRSQKRAGYSMDHAPPEG